MLSSGLYASARQRWGRTEWKGLAQATPWEQRVGCKPTVWGAPRGCPALEHKWVGSSLALGSVHKAPTRESPPWEAGAGFSFVPESTRQYLPWPED